MSASPGRRPRHGRRSHRRLAVSGIGLTIAVAAAVTFLLTHRAGPGSAAPPGPRPAPTSTAPATAVVTPSASVLGPGPPLHDPGNTNPNWIPCKDRLGFSATSDYQLSDEQETEIVACVIASDIARS